MALLLESIADECCLLLVSFSWDHFIEQKSSEMYDTNLDAGEDLTDAIQFYAISCAPRVLKESSFQLARTLSWSSFLSLQVVVGVRGLLTIYMEE